MSLLAGWIVSWGGRDLRIFGGDNCGNKPFYKKPQTGSLWIVAKCGTVIKVFQTDNR